MNTDDVQRSRAVRTIRRAGLYALSLGVVYLGIGSLEILAWGMKANLGPIPGDPFGGFILLVIGGIYLFGARGLWGNRSEGLAGLLVGTSLALIFGGLYLLVMGADGLSYLIGDLESWRPLAELRPELWLALLTLPGWRLIRVLRAQVVTEHTTGPAERTER